MSKIIGPDHEEASSQAISVFIPAETLRFPVAFQGEEFRSQSELARKYKISPAALNYRLRSGWTLPEALGLERPPLRDWRRPVSVGGVTFPTTEDAARHFGVSSRIVASRLRRGWTPEEALGLSVRRTRRALIAEVAQKLKADHPEFTLGRIGLILDEMGLKPPRAPCWSDTAVMRLLTLAPED